MIRCRDFENVDLAFLALRLHDVAASGTDTGIGSVSVPRALFSETTLSFVPTRLWMRKTSGTFVCTHLLPPLVQAEQERAVGFELAQLRLRIVGTLAAKRRDRGTGLGRRAQHQQLRVERRVSQRLLGEGVTHGTTPPMLCAMIAVASPSGKSSLTQLSNAADTSAIDGEWLQMPVG